MRFLNRFQFTRMGPDDFQPDDVLYVHAVIWLGHGGEYRFYLGDADWTPEAIAHHGDPIYGGKEAAKAICPNAVEGRYYRS